MEIFLMFVKMVSDAFLVKFDLHGDCNWAWAGLGISQGEKQNVILKFLQV